MKLSTTLSVFAFVGYACAQSCEKVAARVPECAASCYMTSISKAGCTLSDYKCQCSHSSFKMLTNDASSCIESSCSRSDVSKAQKAYIALCDCSREQVLLTQRDVPVVTQIADGQVQAPGPSAYGSYASSYPSVAPSIAPSVAPSVTASSYPTGTASSAPSVVPSEAGSESTPPTTTPTPGRIVSSGVGSLKAGISGLTLAALGGMVLLL